MDFMENVKNIVADTAETVAKKSGELLETSKLKYAIFELKNDVRKLYGEIGKLTYQSMTGGEDYMEEVQMKCDIVQAKLAKIDALNARETSVDPCCPTCGKTAKSGEKYCSGCGASLAVDVSCDVDESDIEDAE